jgi:hypothetical protein
MSETKKSKGLYWIATILSLAATIFLMVFANSWFWVGLPFLFTSLVLALDVM